jgi:hypothetical protein
MHALSLATVSYHESGHAIGVLALKRKIEIIRIEQDLSGHCLLDQRARVPCPAWDSLMATCEVASDFLGVVAAARYHGERALDDDSDIEARGGAGDLKNLRCKLAIICNDNGARMKALRERAWGVAHRLCENYWRSIAKIAEELLCKRRLFHDDVCRCVRAVGDHRLLREQPSATMPVRAHPMTKTIKTRDGLLLVVDARSGVPIRYVTRPARL